MIKQVYRIDSEGFYIELVILEDDRNCPGDCVELTPPGGLYKLKWNGSSWDEGLSQEEIVAIKNAPVIPSEIDLLKKQQALM
jgi:hypothetical protein